MTVPIPILRARHLCNNETPGERVPWEIGELAIATLRDGVYRVRIDSELKAHADAPGEHVYECVFLEEGGARFAISSKALRIP